MLAAAYGHELTKFGIPVGHTNYAAGIVLFTSKYTNLLSWVSAYATGLLVARRVLKKLKLDTKYQGNKTINGEDYMVAQLMEMLVPSNVSWMWV